MTVMSLFDLSKIFKDFMLYEDMTMIMMLKVVRVSKMGPTRSDCFIAGNTARDAEGVDLGTALA